MNLPSQNIFAEFNTPRPTGPTFHEDGGRIRVATSNDLGAAAKIAAEREGGPTRRHLKAMREFVDADTTHLTVAELRGEIVGFGKVAYLTPDARPNVIPEGWYLAGVIVRPTFRQRGAGRVLTSERIAWLRTRTPVVHYFASAQNDVSITMHKRFGFVEVARNIVVPGASFTGGVGLLFRLDLTARLPSAAEPLQG